MSKSREEVDSDLEKAIAALIPHLELPENVQLGDWLLIACTPYVDELGKVAARYFLAMPPNGLLEHVATGLVTKAEDILASGVADDEGA